MTPSVGSPSRRAIVPYRQRGEHLHWRAETFFTAWVDTVAARSVTSTTPRTKGSSTALAAFWIGSRGQVAAAGAKAVSILSDTGGSCHKTRGFPHNHRCGLWQAGKLTHLESRARLGTATRSPVAAVRTVLLPATQSTRDAESVATTRRRISAFMIRAIRRGISRAMQAATMA